MYTYQGGMRTTVGKGSVKNDDKLALYVFLGILAVGGVYGAYRLYERSRPKKSSQTAPSTQ